MKFLNWNSWSIKARMLVITALPLAMIISVIAWSYLTRLNEIKRDLQERGNLIATTLAESSEYGVISGNLTNLERTIRGLLQIDHSIYSIEIQDFNRKSLVRVSSNSAPLDQTQVFEAQIRKELVDVNPFGVNNQPHLSDAFDLPSDANLGAVVGHVRVTMSPASMLANKRMRILTGTAIASAFLFITSLIAFVLASGLTKPLAATVSAVRRIREGNYQPDLQVTAGGEMAELQASIIEMAESLGEVKQNLEGKVRERTEELAKARDAAVKADAEKRRLIQKVTTAVEEERKNIAIDIHDHLNATVIVVRFELQRILSLATRVEEQLNADKGTDEETLNRMHQIKNIAASSLEHLKGLYIKARDLVKSLRPEVIDTLGLRDAVDEMVRHYDEIHPNCRFEFRAEGDFTAVCSQAAISSYRLVQEALSNVVKHSAASIAKVRLVTDDNQHMLSITVSDNGKGFDVSKTEAGIGMIGMRERVYGLNGKLDVKSEVDAGTTVHIELPLASQAF